MTSHATIKGSGQNSEYWSISTGTNVNFAYYLDFANDIIRPSASLNRYYAFPLRCLAS